VNCLRDEKDSALSELRRLKALYHDRVSEVSGDANLRIAQLEGLMLEQKEAARAQQELSYEVIRRQQVNVEKMAEEHRATVEHFEKVVKGVKTENKHLLEQ
jgi:hypothetical protein